MREGGSGLGGALARLPKSWKIAPSLRKFSLILEINPLPQMTSVWRGRASRGDNCCDPESVREPPQSQDVAQTGRRGRTWSAQKRTPRVGGHSRLEAESEQAYQ